MVKCTKENFEQWKPKIEEDVTNACFVAIDFEFFGLDTFQISLFDTPAERYEILRSTVLKYHPCQVGISCFFQEPSGRFKADIFSIPLLKLHGCSETFISFDAINFLHNNNFDVDKVFKDGVQYSDRAEMERFKNYLKSGEVTSLLAQKISMLKLSLHEECYNQMLDAEFEDEEFEGTGIGKVKIETMIEEPIVLKVQEVKNDKNRQKLDCLNVAIILHQLTIWNENLLFCADENLEKITVSQLPVGVSPSENLEAAEKRCLQLFRGVAHFFELLSARKTVLVGHNCLLDTMYIFHYFFQSLPETYHDFKKKLRELFPNIIDTKILANSLKEVLRQNQLPNHSLEALGDFFITDASERMIPTEVRVIAEWKVLDDPENSSYHDAGFDAYVTGEIFVKLAHIYINRDYKTKRVVKFGRILEYLKQEVINRLPFTLIDVDSCNLEEDDDEVGSRPDSIRIMKRNGEKVDNEDFRSVKNCLQWHLDEYKFCMRLSIDRYSVEIATNTAPTYAIVCAKFSNNSDYILFDELNTATCLSYEQRLTSFRFGKNEDFSRSNCSKKNLPDYDTLCGKVLQMEIAMSDCATANFEEKKKQKWQFEKSKLIVSNLVFLSLCSFLLVRKFC